MITDKDKLIEKIEIKFKNKLKDKQDAYDIYDKIDFIDNNYLEHFISSSLNVFNTKDEAFNWYLGDELRTHDLLIMIEDITIDKSMIDKTFKEVMMDEFLNVQDNYLEVNNHIYLTWWL